MAFDIYLLDKLDYDDAEPLLEDYIYDALEAFAASKVGEARVKAYPQGGNWIGTFIEFAYLYGGFTLPKMTKGNAQEVMEYILPRKLTLLDPSDTDEAIGELVAFWTFLDDVYRFRSAKAIAKYLRSIEDKFPQWMFDPDRGGIAKNFMMQGTEAGFDMTTEEGIQAFQAEYNQRLKSNPAADPLPMPPMPTVPMEAAPPDMQRAFEQLGIELPPVGQPVNLMELMGTFMSAVEQLDPEAAEQLMTAMEAEMDADAGPVEGPPDFRTEYMQQALGGEVALSDDEADVLRSQTITPTDPGTILQDFQTVLDFIGDKGIPVSGKLQHISLKYLRELNDQLSTSVDLDLKRPVQKSYPNIHGLYLLLRATGITRVDAKGKQYRLVRHPDIYQSWQQLNPTEQYFTLLEAWLIRGNPEILGEERSGSFTVGDRCLQTWPDLTRKKALTFSDYKDQDRIHYWPGLYNIALMGMFGLLKVTPGKPTQGNGWRIKRIEAQPFGQALMKRVYNAFVEADCQWPSLSDPSQPFGELQSVFQPYFPEWQHNLAIQSHAFRPDRHIFKVSLGKAWRRIAIAGEATLADLANLILDSVEFDHDHLDQFTYKDGLGRTIEAMHPAYGGGMFDRHVGPSTDEVKIGSLPLSEGMAMEYLFDFGDCWEFQVVLEAIAPMPDEPSSGKGFQKIKQTKRRQRSPQRPVGEIIEAHGKAPEQYPDYDEE